mgnify:CR=1 FL=1
MPNITTFKSHRNLIRRLFSVPISVKKGIIVLKEHLNVLNEGIHAEIYDKYSFDEFDITSFKGNKYVFLNGTKQLTNDKIMR